MKKIVLIDDEYLSRESLKDSLAWNYYGYQICGEAANGQTGLDVIHKWKPDVIFLDIKMPVMDGLTLLKRLHEENIRSKVIMLSCYDDFDYVREAMRLGALDYLLKHTYEEEDLIHIVQKLNELFVKEDALTKGLNSLRQETLQKIVMGKTKPADYEAFQKSGVLPQIASCYMTACLQIAAPLPDSFTLFHLFDTILAGYQKDKPDTYCYFQDIFMVDGLNNLFYLLSLFTEGTSAARQKSCVKDFLGYAHPHLISLKLGWLAGLSYHSYTLWENLSEACMEAREMLSDEIPLVDCSAKVLSGIAYIKANYATPLSLEDIAEHAGVSRIYFSQLFKKEMGLNVSDYLLRYRLTKAKELLLYSNLKVYTIAELCGFGTVQYFSQLFKRETGQSPYQYRDCRPNK